MQEKRLYTCSDHIAASCPKRLSLIFGVTVMLNFSKILTGSFP